VRVLFSAASLNQPNPFADLVDHVGACLRGFHFDSLRRAFAGVEHQVARVGDFADDQAPRFPLNLARRLAVGDLRVEQLRLHPAIVSGEDRPRAVEPVREFHRVGENPVRPPEQSHQRVHAVDADVHQRPVGERRVEGIFDDSRLEFVVA